MKVVLLRVLLVSALMSGSCLGAVIDDFSRTSQSGVVYGTPYDGVLWANYDGFSVVDITAGVFGGSRKVDFGLSGSEYDNFNIIDKIEWASQSPATLNLGPGSLAEVMITYDANGAGLNADMSGSTKITLDYDPDHVGFQRPNVISMTLEDSDSDSATVSYTYSVYANPPRTLLDFTFADFLTDNPALDIDSIEKVVFEYVSDSANDVAFYGITTDGPVPEPATLLLLSMGGLWLRKRS